MGSLNKVHLIGNLGQGAELKYTASGKPVMTLSVATNEKWKDNTGKLQERTEWHRVNVWGKQAENLAAYLEKGKQIYVEGKLQTRKWQDKDGVTRYSTEIHANPFGGIVLLGSKGHGGPHSGAPEPDDSYGGNYGGNGTSQGGDEPPPPDDDVPF